MRILIAAAGSRGDVATNTFAPLVHDAGLESAVPPLTRGCAEASRADVN
jgi:hypothetical protein